MGTCSAPQPVRRVEPMLLKRLECRVSMLVISDACPRPTTDALAGRCAPSWYPCMGVGCMESLIIYCKQAEERTCATSSPIPQSERSRSASTLSRGTYLSLSRDPPHNPPCNKIIRQSDRGERDGTLRSEEMDTHSAFVRPCGMTAMLSWCNPHDEDAELA